MSVDAYPLSWPTAWPRTSEHEREEGRYKYRTNSGFLSMYKAQSGLYSELERLGVESVIVSSNLVRNLDGSIRSGQRRPEDPGIAIYFKWNGKDMVMAMDDFIEPECNVRRLTLAIKAMRDLERNGGGTMMEKAFTGFAALPAPMSGGGDWRAVLNFRFDEYPSGEEIRTRFKSMAKQHHSDKGGNDVDMAALIQARDAALGSVA
ncbi:J domain-containing protein [Litorimonas haliclonae]|uniref:J domain-containing protein n=1 Tax=Litorimonas haliclonae TaxID=2081977 RepID=UPI0039F062D7